MSSAPPTPSGSSSPADDRTARARIRDAAIERFAADGVASTSIRTIAEAAGVSPPLVIHHFGSKDELRVACDQHVAAVIRDQKSAAVTQGQGPGFDPFAGLRGYRDGPPLLRYLAKTLADGSPHVADLVDEMVADATRYTAEGVRSGMLKPTDHPEGRAAILTIWSLGALVLHEHLARVLGGDIDIVDDPLNAVAYFLPATELLARGVIADEVYEQVLASLAAHQDEEERS